MTFWSVAETVFIGPLKLVFEIIFQLTNELVENPGLSIIVLSLLMNVLVLPLYRRADAMQEQSRDVEAKLHDGVAHIKKTFSGDERMMILQAYYRQNNYKPTDVLHGSASLLLEIPFFMAAYQFLSHLSTLNGASLGPINDLGAPDGLLSIGGLTINLLPVLMTLINVISSALYLKGFPLKTKIQLYGMAAFFLVFLYTSPAGLVFYWTLNNVFSLVKNIFYKIKNPQKVLRVLLSVLGIAAAVSAAFAGELGIPKAWGALLAVGLLLQLPLLVAIIKNNVKWRPNMKWPAPNRKLFLVGALFLAVFIGLTIPTTYIAASPQEFVDINHFHHPLWYVVSSVGFAAGTFLVWVGVFYWLATPKGKVLFERILWVLCGVAAVNYMFFGTNLGNLSAALVYDTGVRFTVYECVMNAVVLCALAAVLYFAVIHWTKVVRVILLTATLALVVMSAVNAFTISRSVGELKSGKRVNENAPHFELSQEGQNVVVIMLDRALGELVPYLVAEKPELKEAFDGFTYYSNVISFGGNTNFGVPPTMGGYEYTPVEMNKRQNELLKDKHNESLKVMPSVFSQHGYNVTVCDAPYANYTWVPDMSIYDDIPNVNTYITKGYFGTPEMKERTIQNNYRNFFCFSLMKSMPLCMQSGMYSGGTYNQAKASGSTSTTQARDGYSRAEGLSQTFMDPYTTLCNMNAMTKITEENEKNFLFFFNDVTHESMLLKEPEYVPSETVDNTVYDQEHMDRFTVDGKTITIEDDVDMAHYQTNMAALLELGKWFDYLRENGVYDNTKIILVADHGSSLWLMKNELNLGYLDVGRVFPLLMVKDYNATGFTVSEEFMTHADVPTLAFKDAIDNPVNPFTGKPINSAEKTAHDQFIIESSEWDVNVNNGNTFIPSGWYSVSSDIWDKNDWEYYPEAVVLKEHAMPQE